MVFLHGILGSGSNWRTFASKLVTARPDWGAMLVDLRMHGQSAGFAPPHTIRACAEDVLAACEKAPGPVSFVVGHSFGGKVALELLRLDERVQDAWILDSTPSARPSARGSESTVQIVSLLERLPPRFPTREAFVEEIMRAGNDRAIAMWLAMQVKPSADGTGYEWRIDLAAIRALLDDYFLAERRAVRGAVGAGRAHGRARGGADAHGRATRRERARGARDDPAVVRSDARGDVRRAVRA